MNLDEAIRITDPATRQEALYKYDPEERDSVEVEARHMAAQALREKQTGGWISVKERLPERPEHDWVLVIARFGTEGIFGVPHVAEYVSGKWQFRCLDSTDAEDFLQVTVTHWQPLPEPPKEEFDVYDSLFKQKRPAP